MTGVLIIDKPEGWTSHDVVAYMKKRLGARKVGHLGTLDPIATGVLPLVIDGATKFARFLDGGKKEYVARMRLGVETDTYDGAGNIVAEADCSRISEAEIERVLSSFRGRITQTPPMYSAIKKNGTPLYKLARKGVTVERAAKDVEVFTLDVTAVELPSVEFRAVCSKGTYIRSICFDAGKALGCGAHMAALRRVRCGGFSIDEAVGPKAEIEAVRSGIIPLEAALARSQAPLEAAGGMAAG